MYVVLDSNIYLHYISFEDIPWPLELGCEDIEFIVPSVVLEEIDRVKDLEKGKVQKRAKTVSSRLGEILIDGKTGKYPVHYKECPAFSEEERQRYHLGSNDNQILFSIDHSELDNALVCIVSSDIAMLIRAKQFGFAIHQLDDKYRVQTELSKEEKDAQLMAAELARLKNRQPSPKLVFSNENSYIQIRRTVPADIEAVVKKAMDRLSMEFPEKTIQDCQEIVLGQVINLRDPGKIAEYNISRKKFLELSEKKKRLEAMRDDYDSRMVHLVVSVTNVGTSPTGKMNIFLDIPEGVHIYDGITKQHYKYEKPETPSFFPLVSYPSYISPIYGYQSPSIEMWDMNSWERRTQLTSTEEPLTHMLMHKVFDLYVDSATCPSFKMRWRIVDAALIESVQGELNVSFVD